MDALTPFQALTTAAGAEVLPAPPAYAKRMAAKTLTTEVSTSYRPSLPGAGFWNQDNTTPNFARFIQDVPAMMANSHVKKYLGAYIAGCAACEFELEDASTPEAGQFALDEWSRFWTKRRSFVQRVAYPYGRGAFELVYEEEDGRLRLANVNGFVPTDARVLTREGRYVGVRVKGVAGKLIELWGPGLYPAKAFWLTHERMYHKWYGWPRLYGAWLPWRRLAGRDGANDIIDGGAYRVGIPPIIVRHPPEDQFPSGVSPTPGAYRSNADVAREMAANIKSNASIAMSNRRDEAGEYEWQAEFPKAVLDLASLLEYAGSLEKAIAVGIGVPPEMEEASETGSGYSGRAIPREAFLDQQQDNAEEMLEAWQWQIGDPLLRWNFGPDAWARIKAKSMNQASKEQAQAALQPPGEDGEGGGEKPGGKPEMPGRPTPAMVQRQRQQQQSAAQKPVQLSALPEDDDTPEERARLVARILYGLYGYGALAFLEERDGPLDEDGPAGVLFAWDESRVNRHPKGSGKGGQFAKKGSAESVASAQDYVRQAIAGKVKKADAPEMVRHLNNLTVAQLRAMAAEHGRKVPKLLRAELEEAVLALLKEEQAEEEEKPQEPTTAEARNQTITRTSSMKNVDAYRVGGLLEVDGAWHVIERYSRRQDDHGRYEHTLQLRPAAEGEAKRGEAEGLRAKLSSRVAGPDDDRDRPAFEAETARLKARLDELEPPLPKPKPPAEAERRRAAADALKIVQTVPRGKRTDEDWDAIAAGMFDGLGKQAWKGWELPKNFDEEELTDWLTDPARLADGSTAAKVEAKPDHAQAAAVPLRDDATSLARKAASALAQAAADHPHEDWAGGRRVPVAAIRERLTGMSREEQDQAIRDLVASAFTPDGERSVSPDEVTDMTKPAARDAVRVPRGDSGRGDVWGWLVVNAPKPKAEKPPAAAPAADASALADAYRRAGKMDAGELSQTLDAVGKLDRAGLVDLAKEMGYHHAPSASAKALRDGIGDFFKERRRGAMIDATGPESEAGKAKGERIHARIAAGDKTGKEARKKP